MVTPDPRLQGCLILNNKTGDSTRESSLLWVSPVDTCPVFSLIQCVVLYLGLDLQWCLRDLHNFFLFRKNGLVRGLLCYTVAYKILYTWVSILKIRIQYVGCSVRQSCTYFSNIFLGRVACPCLIWILLCFEVF